MSTGGVYMLVLIDNQGNKMTKHLKRKHRITNLQASLLAIVKTSRIHSYMHILKTKVVNSSFFFYNTNEYFTL